MFLVSSTTKGIIWASLIFHENFWIKENVWISLLLYSSRAFHPLFIILVMVFFYFRLFYFILSSLKPCFCDWEVFERNNKIIRAFLSHLVKKFDSFGLTLLVHLVQHLWLIWFIWFKTFRTVSSTVLIHLVQHFEFEFGSKLLVHLV